MFNLLAKVILILSARVMFYLFARVMFNLSARDMFRQLLADGKQRSTESVKNISVLLNSTMRPGIMRFMRKHSDR